MKDRTKYKDLLVDELCELKGAYESYAPGTQAIAGIILYIEDRLNKEPARYMSRNDYNILFAVINSVRSLAYLIDDETIKEPEDGFF